MTAVPSETMMKDDDDCQLLLDYKHHGDSSTVPLSMTAWATPALQELNKDLFSLYSHETVTATMWEHAQRIDEYHFQQLKCVPTTCTTQQSPSPTWRMIGIGNEPTSSHVMNAQHHLELVMVVVTGLLMEVIWLVWFVYMPCSAMGFLVATLVAWWIVYHHKTCRRSPRVVQSPDHKNNHHHHGLMTVEKLQLLIHPKSANDNGNGNNKWLIPTHHENHNDLDLSSTNR